MKNANKQQFIILAIGVVVTVGVGIFRYVPIVRQRYAVQKQIEQQSQIIGEVRSLSVLVPELKEQKKQLEKQLLAFEEKVPQGRNLAELWRQVAEVMNECGLTDQLVQPGAEIASEQLCCIPLTIECKGSLGQLYSFFQSLEKINRLVRIEQVTMDSGGDFSSVVKLKAQANVYYQPDESENG